MLERFWNGCGHCKGEQPCPIVTEWEQAESGGREGVALLPVALTALVVFILPLTCGILGAWLAGRWWHTGSGELVGWRQAMGLLVGLAAGVGFAKLLLFSVGKAVSNAGRGGE